MVDTKIISDYSFVAPLEIDLNDLIFKAQFTYPNKISNGHR